MIFRLGFFVVLLAAGLASAVANPLADLEPGHWYEVADSRLLDVAPDPAAHREIQGNLGVKAVMDNWSGGAYDSRRQRLVVWGGGHRGYAGNELYAFDVDALKWERLTSPSPVSAYDGKNPALPDGNPVSRHTYNNLVYLPPPYDALWAQGGSRWWEGGSDKATWMFDFEAKQWRRLADTEQSYYLNYSAYDPVENKVWHHPNQHLQSYDPQTDRWTGYGKKRGLWADRSNAIDPKRRLLVLIGQGQALAYDLTGADGFRQNKLKTTGATEILKARSPGFVYDPVSDRLVAWGGGPDVYTLNLDTLVWERHPPASGNKVLPTEPSARGTYGRFQYVPAYNAFVLVNAVDENVYFYKLNAKAGVAANKPTVGAYIRRTGDYFKTPGAAAKAAIDGDVVEILTGAYHADAAVWTQNNLTLRGLGGRAQLLSAGNTAQGKGIWVIKGDNVTVENVEFSGASAGIWLEGAGLTVRNCYFYGNRNGLRGGHPQGEVLIEHSGFAGSGSGDGQSHDIHIDQGQKLTLRYSTLHGSRAGPSVWSAARENVIENNMIYAAGGDGQALVLARGGVAHIRGNLLHQGAQPQPAAFIRFGAEGLPYGRNELVIRDNLLVNDAGAAGALYRADGVKAVADNNVVRGK